MTAATCRYCAGKGGRYRLVYSRFLGCEPQVHEGPWEKCWACNGTGKKAERVDRRSGSGLTSATTKRERQFFWTGWIIGLVFGLTGAIK